MSHLCLSKPQRGAAAGLRDVAQHADCFLPWGFSCGDPSVPGAPAWDMGHITQLPCWLPEADDSVPAAQPLCWGQG